MRGELRAFHERNRTRALEMLAEGENILHVAFAVSEFMRDVKRWRREARVPGLTRSQMVDVASHFAHADAATRADVATWIFHAAGSDGNDYAAGVADCLRAIQRDRPNTRGLA